jgi:hypothetical protein
VNIRGQGALKAETSGTGDAGDVAIAAQQIAIAGSTITTQATQAGNAGNITLAAPENIDLQSGASIVASSDQSVSGQIKLASQKLNLDASNIQATIGKSGGTQEAGRIDLDISFRIDLANESLIETRGTNGANGGDISLGKVRILYARRPSGANGNDINGRAIGGGQGGQVKLDRITFVQGFRFGEAVEGNRTNDIDTNEGRLENSSTLADEGTRGLAAPVVVFEDVSQLGRGVCEVANVTAGDGQSELRLTWQGGIPQSATTPLTAQTTSLDWATMEFTPAVQVQVKTAPDQLVTLQPGRTYRLPGSCVKSSKRPQAKF